MSRATIIGPDSESRVLMGYCDKVRRMSAMGWFRSIFTTWALKSAGLTGGRYWAGWRSRASKNTPSRVIFALIWRSALQLTPMPTGQLAP